MPDLIAGIGSEFVLADAQFAQKCRNELSSECGFEYDAALAQLHCQTLAFYPRGTWLCRLTLAPQTVRKRRRRRELRSPTNLYFIFRPSDVRMPIMPLGNDTIWILRANYHYGLRLKGKGGDDEDPVFDQVAELSDDTMMRRIVEYLHFYYSFTRYDAYAGGPVRFRVPRTLQDLQFSTAAADEDRQQAAGALWRFLDRDGSGQIHPAIGTVVRFINRYHADVPIQVASSLWRLRVSVRLGSGFVRLYGRVPFFYSPHLLPPLPDQVESLPVPRQLFWSEPWLLMPERMRSAIGAMAYFVLAVTWLIALLVSVGFASSYLLHPALVQGFRDALAGSGSGAWTALSLSATYFIAMFALVSVFVLQVDGGLSRAARAAPGALRVAYRALERFQRYVWDRFRPRLETPFRKGATAALWLVVSSVLLVCSFTTLQVAQVPHKFSGDIAGQHVLMTFTGHATIAFPGIPYLLGAIGLDPLKWLSDPLITSGIVLWFRGMMLVIVYRAFWKLLGYTSPRILYRDSRRLEFELSKQRRRLKARLQATPAT
jgi:hypothetical protein